MQTGNIADNLASQLNYSKKNIPLLRNEMLNKGWMG
jgi:hypothetical protein